MTEAHLTPAAETRDAKLAATRASQDQVARELAALGIRAVPFTGEADSPGVWLRTEDAELAVRVLHWAASRGVIITREQSGLLSASEPGTAT